MLSRFVQAQVDSKSIPSPFRAPKGSSENRVAFGDVKKNPVLQNHDWNTKKTPFLGEIPARFNSPNYPTMSLPFAALMGVASDSSTALKVAWGPFVWSIGVLYDGAATYVYIFVHIYIYISKYIWYYMRYILYMHFFARITNARLKLSYHLTGGEFEQTPYIGAYYAPWICWSNWNHLQIGSSPQVVKPPKTIWKPPASSLPWVLFVFFWQVRTSIHQVNSERFHEHHSF